MRWPEGPQCPHRKCRAETGSVALIGGEKQSHRPGLYRCKVCRGQFSVTVGTVLQGSRVPLTGWWRAASLLSANERDAYVSASDIQHALEVNYRTAHGVLWKILNVAAAFRGHMSGFGKPIRDHARKRTEAENKKQGAVWRRAKQARASADAILAFQSSAASTAIQERTERVASARAN